MIERFQRHHLSQVGTISENSAMVRAYSFPGVAVITGAGKTGTFYLSSRHRASLQKGQSRVAETSQGLVRQLQKLLPLQDASE